MKAILAHKDGGSKGPTSKTVLYQNDPVPKQPHSRNSPYQQRLTFM